jgi:hypothetical protein
MREGSYLLSLTIVIGTGRCGSTMLSRMLSMHPEVLSLSEFWNVLRTSADELPTHVMGGEEFWQRITKPDPYTDGMELAGIPHDEFLYPADRRFDPASGVPAICRVLAALGDDPDGLYDRLALAVPRWPRRPMADHCRALFAELAAILGRSVVVERTGGDLTLVSVLQRQFPEARFVFLHRNGPDSALSMSRHPSYRLAALQMLAAAAGQPATPQLPLPEEIRRARPEDFEGLVAPPFDKQRFGSFPVPLAIFGWMWAGGTRAGTSDIRALPHDCWVPLRYEQLLSNPRAELSRLANFIGITAEQQWLDRTSEFVDAGRTGGSGSRLHPGALAELRASCASGTRAFDLLESEYASANALSI